MKVNTLKAFAMVAAVCMAGNRAFAGGATGPCTVSPLKYTPVPGGFAATPAPTTPVPFEYDSTSIPISLIADCM